MATVCGRFITALVVISIISSIGCAARRPAPPSPPPVVMGQEWEPFHHRRQMWLAAFDGGAAVNREGFHHVLTRMKEEPLRRRPDGPNPCRTLRLKIEALERCELDRKACTFPLE